VEFFHPPCRCRGQVATGYWPYLGHPSHTGNPQHGYLYLIYIYILYNPNYWIDCLPQTGLPICKSCINKYVYIYIVHPQHNKWIDYLSQIRLYVSPTSDHGLCEDMRRWGSYSKWGFLVSHQMDSDCNRRRHHKECPFRKNRSWNEEKDGTLGPPLADGPLFPMPLATIFEGPITGEQLLWTSKPLASRGMIIQVSK
jgi:hypothetical protein